MSLLKRIELYEFRRFSKYVVDGLSRVNLLVGSNNCGKTSILESQWLLAARGAPWALYNATNHRGELTVVEGEPRPVEDVSHWFHGHEFSTGRHFTIRAIGHDAAGAEMQRSLAAHIVHDKQRPQVWFLKLLYGASSPKEDSSSKIPVSRQGAVREQAPSVGFDSPKAAFVRPYAIEADNLGQMWDRAVLDGVEGDVTTALRIIEPRISSLVFLTRMTDVPRNRRSGVVARYEGEKRPLPFGSEGDGMYRLLELALSMVQSSQGVLLVDEVDSGLHYSLLGDVWRFVVEAARRFDVQVFATTHSYDCIRGLAWLCENHPDLGKDVALHKIEPRLEESIPFDAEQILIAFDQRIEVR